MKSWSHTATWVPNWSMWLGRPNDNSGIQPPQLWFTPIKMRGIESRRNTYKQISFTFCRKNIDKKRKGGRPRPPLVTRGLKPVNEARIFTQFECRESSMCQTPSKRRTNQRIWRRVSVRPSVRSFVRSFVSLSVVSVRGVHCMGQRTAIHRNLMGIQIRINQ